MNDKYIIEYLRKWAELHTHSVYNSPREYISLWELKSELNAIEHSLED